MAANNQPSASEILFEKRFKFALLAISRQKLGTLTSMRRSGAALLLAAAAVANAATLQRCMQPQQHQYTLGLSPLRFTFEHSESVCVKVGLAMSACWRYLHASFTACTLSSWMKPLRITSVTQSTLNAPRKKQNALSSRDSEWTCSRIGAEVACEYLSVFRSSMSQQRNKPSPQHVRTLIILLVDEFCNAVCAVSLPRRFHAVRLCG